MGFMDGFTSDGTVDMKHTEYYNLMKEAAKAELLSNAVKAEVPGFYIQAMITGEKPEFLSELKAEEEDTGFHAESGVQIHGVLGIHFLVDYEWIIDFKELKISDSNE